MHSNIFHNNVKSNLHLDWTSPSMASLRMTSLPTWRSRSSTRRWRRWTSCMRSPPAPSSGLGSSLPVESWSHLIPREQRCKKGKHCLPSVWQTSVRTNVQTFQHINAAAVFQDSYMLSHRNWGLAATCGPNHNYTNEHQFRSTLMTQSLTFFYKFPVLTAGGPRFLHAFLTASLPSFHCTDRKVHRTTAAIQRKMCFQLMSSEISLMQYWWT